MAAQNFSDLAPNTPVLIGAGQYVEREAGDTSPMQLAARAALAALDNTADRKLAASIDTKGFSHCHHGNTTAPT